MPLKKIKRAFRKITRPIKKLIPREIKPFAPYIAAAMVPGGGILGGLGGQGLQRAVIAGLTRGAVDDDANFRDVLRTGVTAALPNIIKTGSNALAAKLDPQLAADVAGNIDEASAIYANKGNVVEGASLKEKLASGLSKIGQSETLGKLTSGSVLNKPTSGAIITAGSMDEARKLIDQYEEGLDGPYDRKNDRGALFAIFQNANWGTDDEINDMLDRYGYMGGGSVMPMQTGIAGALPMPNTRPGYDKGGILMASAILGDESDDIALELFGKRYKDLNPAELDEFNMYLDNLEKKFMKKNSKKNMLMASYGYNDAMSDTYSSYLDMKKKGLIPPTMSFDEFLQEVVPEMSKRQDTSGMMASAPDPAAERNSYLEMMSERFYGKPLKDLTPDEFMDLEEALDDMGMKPMPKGRTGTAGRTMAAEGGIMDLGGMEKDYRNEGGFVPIGEKERADDVPARLSLNEFVMTADAVRNAGDGDIDKGAEVMENVMKNLEEGGSISEESQGKEGARRMFNTMEGMEAVI